MEMYNRNATLASLVLLLVSRLLSGCVASTNSKPITITGSSIDSLPNTLLLSTMDHTIDSGKNAVYAVSLPLAWGHLRETLGGQLTIPDQNKDLLLLNQSHLVQGTLEDKDYEKSIERNGDYLKVTTKQNVYLTFQPAFKRRVLEAPFFGAAPTPAFGTYDADNVLHGDKIDVLVYQSDTHFAVRLNPNESDHEILLYRTDESFQSLSAMYEGLFEQVAEGDLAKRDPKTSWRYDFTEFDELLVPDIDFSLAHDYPNLVGQQIEANHTLFTLDGVRQAVAFVLDEKGASMQTEAEIVVNMAGVPDDDAPKPKNLIFDGPFFVVVKKTNASNPYFVLYVANGELLRKEETL